SGKPRFREAGAAWGVNDPGFATHAAFFDYDRDGDLDLYVLNNAFRPLSTFDLSKNLRDIRDEKAGGDCLYRNDGERFSDVSAEAGILGSVIAFGLGLSVSDVDNDGWMDIYVANDFFEKDYLYLNNQDGTFRES
ncbi:MAG: VCBS repeat-containing protein, partial [Calditrichaeota bacterium]|nr:VCBS repeat-containing protein [Calditrichota bacterium]